MAKKIISSYHLKNNFFNLFEVKQGENNTWDVNLNENKEITVAQNLYKPLCIKAKIGELPTYFICKQNLINFTKENEDYIKNIICKYAEEIFKELCCAVESKT